MGFSAMTWQPAARASCATSGLAVGGSPSETASGAACCGACGEKGPMVRVDVWAPTGGGLDGAGEGLGFGPRAVDHSHHLELVGQRGHGGPVPVDHNHPGADEGKSYSFGHSPSH